MPTDYIPLQLVYNPWVVNGILLLVALATIDWLLGIGRALFQGEFSWTKLPQALATHYQDCYLVAVLGLGGMFYAPLLAVFWAAVTALTLKFMKDIAGKFGYASAPPAGEEQVEQHTAPANPFVATTPPRRTLYGGDMTGETKRSTEAADAVGSSP
ncbi:MAG: hypothetical protein HPY55_06505 [Firmicutes bacterium]|nr:hypothetical protein [Bacillota bacterium]